MTTEKIEQTPEQKALEDFKADFFKLKEQKRQQEEMLKRLQTEKDEMEMARLKEKEEWKSLYETESKKRVEIEQKHVQERNQFVDFHKKNAVLNAVGGFKKDQYSSFIDLKNVEMDENGNVVQSSLDYEVARIKQNYPELLKQANAQALPSEAPRSFNQTENKDVRKMTEKEKMDYKLSLLSKK